MLAVITNLDVTPGRKLFLPIQIRLGAPILHFYSILTFLVTLLILLITYSMSVFSARLYILQEELWGLLLLLLLISLMSSTKPVKEYLLNE